MTSGPSCRIFNSPHLTHTLSLWDLSVKAHARILEMCWPMMDQTKLSLQSSSMCPNSVELWPLLWKHLGVGGMLIWIILSKPFDSRLNFANGSLLSKSCARFLPRHMRIPTFLKNM